MIIEFYFKKRNFEENFSAKIEVDELKQTWPPHGYHPRSPKSERTCNVKPLTVIMRYCAFRPDPEVQKENKETADGAWNLNLSGRKEGGRGRPEWKASGDWGRGLCMFRGTGASMTSIAQNGRPAPSY